MSSNIAINYADSYNYDSLPAAISFSGVYGLLGGYFILQMALRNMHEFLVMAIFCGSHAVSFAIRAAMIAKDSVAENRTVFITCEAIFSASFFGVLYPVYTAILDRRSPETNILNRIGSSRILFRMVLFGAVTFNLIGVCKVCYDPENSIGIVVKDASLVMFLALTVATAHQNILLLSRERKNPFKEAPSQSIGVTRGSFILILICILLLVRSTFMVASWSNTTLQTTEHFWYPLIAAPELASAILYATPGLVPLRLEWRREPGL
ncbi:hypothetical protein BDZ89DRAFT_1074490 [Hymenopellis radicata]|nr:hypothetical protein BDZ89DRAFT_1074490 [Hymenopellis radicata]